MKFLLLMALLFRGTFACTQDTPYPGQPLSGPGGADYLHHSVSYYDYGKTSEGFWLFEPADPKPDSAEVVIFMHGYGAYNPMAYGKWIKHLVAKGNIVIYPRYQRNLVYPPADAFPEKAAVGIKKALEKLQKEGHVKPKLDKVAYLGHSYGGTINAYIGVHWRKLGVPKPACMFLAQPGTAMLKGARLEDYGGLDSDLNLVIVTGEHDLVVGDQLGGLIFMTAVNTPNRNFVKHYRTVSPDSTKVVAASHSEPYCYDLDFDTGIRNYTAKRVLFMSRLNEIDFNCYWKLSDALIEYTRTGKNRQYAFDNTPEQRYLGVWPDGTNMRELRVLLPSMIKEVSLKEEFEQ
jgi:acetyl esterase/lipase